MRGDGGGDRKRRIDRCKPVGLDAGMQRVPHEIEGDGPERRRVVGDKCQFQFLAGGSGITRAGGFGFTAAGNKGADTLNNLALSEQYADLRRKAIRNIGITEGTSAAPSLLAIYQKNSDTETKKAVVDSLFIANDAHDLVTLGRAEKDPSIKREIIGKLALMHSKEATDYMMEILNK